MVNYCMTGTWVKVAHKIVLRVIRGGNVGNISKAVKP